ncbi:MAG: GNAT family N-acetyltransferase [Actinomycetota bacterium]
MSAAPAIVALDLRETPTAERVLDLQRAAYRVEADLIDFDGIPQLHESLADLQAAPETWHGALVGDTIAAAISHRIEDGVADIHRLVVDPAFLRRGLARQLVTHLHTSLPVESFIVSTGAANTPARTLYERLGYRLERVEDVVPGLAIACYRRGA